MKNLKMQVIYFLSLCIFINLSVSAKEADRPTHKGLMGMIEDGDFDHYTDLSNYYNDFSNIDQGKFVKIEIENESSFKDAFENRSEMDCNCDALFEDDRVVKGAKIITSYVESAFIAERLRQEIETPQNIGHLEAGFYIGSVAGFACEYGEIPIFQIKNKKVARAVCAIAAATIAGVGKEVYDSFYPESHTVDHRDAIATALGGVVHLNVFELRW